jgi:hypothetical protein
MASISWTTREPVVSLITGHERRQLPPGDETRHLPEPFVPTGVSGRCRDIHVVQGGQVIEVQDVRLDVVAPEDHVAHHAPVLRNPVGDAERVVQGESRRDGVRRRAHTTDPLRDSRCIQRVTAAEDELEAPEQHAGAPRLLDDTFLGDRLDLQVAFDAGDRVDYDSGHDSPPTGMRS